VALTFAGQSSRPSLRKPQILGALLRPARIRIAAKNPRKPEMQEC